MELNTIGHDQSNLRLLEVGRSAQGLEPPITRRHYILLHIALVFSDGIKLFVEE
jgi:hypothetical protein